MKVRVSSHSAMLHEQPGLGIMLKVSRLALYRIRLYTCRKEIYFHLNGSSSSRVILESKGLKMSGQGNN